MRKGVDPSFYGTESIGKVLLKIAQPVMLALLIQALYNIVDSFFVGKYSEHGLTALSVVYPIQLIAIALAVGTGVGVNTLMARFYAERRDDSANEAAGCGFVISVIMWAIFALVSFISMRFFINLSASAPLAVEYAVAYGNIVCIGSIGLFTESIFTKVHQAEGNMTLPMVAQICGAVCNIVLDPIMIFGMLGFPEMGIAGAAIATVCGQVLAAIITGIKGLRRPAAPHKFLFYTKNIFMLGYPSILMQSLYTVYIMALNMILVGFCDEAVTVLGLYYKIQSFFFIPLTGLQTCMVPVISYNYAMENYERVRRTLKIACGITAAFMIIGTACFELIPVQLLGIFSNSEKVFEIGRIALRIIGISFLPATLSLMMPVFFQAIGKAAPSVLLTLSRQIFCLIPIFYAMSFIGLNYTWIAFPAAETITGTIGIILYIRQIRAWNCGAEIRQKSF